MTLITIIICLVIQRFANIGGLLKGNIFEKYLKLLQKQLSKFNGWIGLAAAVVPILIALGLLHLITLGRLYGLAHLLLMLAVLFFCCDMRDMKTLLAGYFSSLAKHDVETAIKVANESLGDHISKKNHALQREVSKAVLIHSFVSIFAPVFWFIICDIYGVAIYFSIVNFRKYALKVDASYSDLAKAAAKSEDILNFVPMRLIALTYALTGHFTTAFSFCYKKMVSLSMDYNLFVVNTGLKSLDLNMENPEKSDVKENQAVLSMIDRSMLIWGIGLAIYMFGRMIA